MNNLEIPKQARWTLLGLLSQVAYYHTGLLHLAHLLIQPYNNNLLHL